VSSLIKNTDGSARVRLFLETMQQRDLVRARQFLAPEFEMVFPGNVRMQSLEDLVAWGGTRYQTIGKTYERFDEVQLGELSIVYCFGSLSGVWLNGSPFEGIRFIDRFEIRAGLITRQDVWNDLAEALSDSR
jgi:hypothetical protein